MILKQAYIRLLIGTVLPFILFIVGSLVISMYEKGEVENFYAGLVFILTYGFLLLFIPLFLYSLIMNALIVPRLYHSTIFIMFISGCMGVLFPLIPMSIGGSYDAGAIIMAFIIGLVVGYVLKIIYPNNIIHKGEKNAK